MNPDKTEFMCFKQDRAISTLNSKPLNLDEFTYLSSNISSTESDVNICIGGVLTAIDKLLIIRKLDFSDKVKRDFFQVVAMSVLLYGCNTRTQMKCLKEKLDRNYKKNWFGFFV